MRRLVQTLGYIIPAGAMGLVIYSALMQWVWGVQPHPLMFVGLLACLGLFFSGILALFVPTKGRIIAACALVLLSPVLIAWIIALVPLPRITLLPENYVVPFFFLCALATVLFLPHPVRYGARIFLAMCVSGLLIASATYIERAREGEYAWPTVAFFRWSPEPANQLIVQDTIGVIDEQTKDILNTAGIWGTLRGYSASGENKASHRMIVLLQSKPPEGTQFFFPRKGVIVYTFDGKQWQTLPANAPKYSAHFKIGNVMVDDAPQPTLFDERDGIVTSAW